jgi:hypothetical protein
MKCTWAGYSLIRRSEGGRNGRTGERRCGGRRRKRPANQTHDRPVRKRWPEAKAERERHLRAGEVLLRGQTPPRYVWG